MKKTSDIGTVKDDIHCVICKKDIATFKQGKSYIISGWYGDPQGCHEAGHDFMTTDFLSSIVVMDGNPGKEFYFTWKGCAPHYIKPENAIGHFQDHFFVDRKEERKRKLKEIEKTHK